MSSITDILKATGNSFASIANDGITAGDVSGYVDSGSYTLNALLSGSIYGGFPGNKIVQIASPSGVGKTFLALGAAKYFLEANPTGIVVLFESESAITKKMLMDRGIDVKRLAVVPVSTVQEFKHQALKVIDNYEKIDEKDRYPLFFILDSLGMLSTEKEMADSLEGKDTKDMTRAQLIKAAFRVITLRLGRAKLPLVVTNHVYASLSMYGGDITSGGSGVTYSSSATLMMTKAKEKDTTTNEMTGAIVTITAAKSRLTKENTRIKCLIRFEGGLDRYYGLLDLAEACGAFKKVSTRYELPDGSKQFGKAIMGEPERFFTKDILDKIDEYVQVKFCYGVSGHEDDVFVCADEVDQTQDE